MKKFDFIFHSNIHIIYCLINSFIFFYFSIINVNIIININLINVIKEKNLHQLIIAIQ